jgi:Flp pilus assembly protein CpaB
MNRNTRTLIVLLVAIATAAAATVLVYQAIQRRPVQQVARPQAFVVVAAKPLANGSLIAATDVKVIGGRLTRSSPAPSPRLKTWSGRLTCGRKRTADG